MTVRSYPSRFVQGSASKGGTMHANPRITAGQLILSCVTVVALSLTPLSPVAAASSQEPAAPAGSPPAAATGPIAVQAAPTASCTLAAGVRTCDLWAKAGTLDLPGGVTVDVLGYADNASGPASVPGPTIEANVGETLRIVLHNDLSAATSLSLPHLDLVPDLTGAAPGDTATTEVDLTRPGTTLYEAGLTPQGPTQVALGMAGALVVRPADPATAYGDEATRFDEEHVVVVQEIDPGLNAHPGTFEMSKYRPTYRLINGAAYPDTGALVTAPGHTTLLRYVNAGLQDHPMSLLGATQTVAGANSYAAPHPQDVVSQLVEPGTTADALVHVPADAAPGTRYPLYEAAEHLNNAGATTSGMVDFGGMMTFLTVSGQSGPVTTAPTATPARTSGGTVTVTAHISDANTGGQDVDQAELYIDDTSNPANAVPMTLTPTTGPEVDASVDIDASTLSSGTHRLYVRGHDATDGWGPFASTVLVVDTQGPLTTAIDIAPDPSNGTPEIVVDATGDDSGRGGTDVTEAEYAIDTGCPADGSGTAMDLVGDAGPSSDFTATIPTGLAPGNHTLAVHARDALGSWGPCATTTVHIDATGPVTSGVVIAPASVPRGTPSSVSATVSDAASTVVAAEWFIGTDPGAGSGNPMTATDGVFNSATEEVSAPINTSALAPGSYPVRVRGKDIAGNWGAVTTGTLVVTAADSIFADGFESGSTNAWSTTSGGSTRISVTHGAALEGSWGLRTVVNGNTPSYVRDNSPDAETSYHGRFRFDPNGTTTAGSDHDIFAGRNGSGTVLFRLRYRTSAGSFQVRSVIQRTSGVTRSAWISFSDAPHVFELSWQSSASGTSRLWIDGTVRATLTGLNTGSRVLQEVRLGPSAGLVAGMSGVEFYDDFKSSRTTFIG